MALTPQELREHRLKLVQTNRALLDKVEAEKRLLNQLEHELFDATNQQIDELGGQIERVEKQERREAEMRRLQPRKTEDDPIRSNPAQSSDAPTVWRDSAGRKVRAARPGEQFCRNRDVPDLGRLLAALVTRDWSGAEFEHRALSGLSDTGGGYLLQGEFGEAVIDAVRSQSVALRNCTVVEMSDSELRIAKFDSDPTSAWLAELVASGDDSPTLGRLTLRARTLRAHIPVSEEILMDAANLPSVLSRALVASLSQKLDAAIISGGSAGDSESPEGLRTVSGVTELTGVGSPLYTDFSSAVQKCQENNSPPDAPLFAILHPRDLGTLDRLAATDTQPLIPPQSWSQLTKLVTTAVSTTEGGGTNESYAIVGPLSTAIVGMRLQPSIYIGGPLVGDPSKFQRSIVCALRADAVVPRPAYFTRLLGITT